MARIVLFVLSLVLSGSAVGADSAPPLELEKWRTWVLDKHPDIDCPRLDVQASNRRCAWPGLLRIDVTENGASFAQDWQVDGDSWLALPGNQQHWPVEVQVNGDRHPVLERDGWPVVRVIAGTHTLSGTLEWRQRPQFLQIPLESALIQVSIDGQRLGWPNIDATGRLWFARPDADLADAEKGDRARLEVFRRVIDGVPITMDTILRLVVSGKPRELQMGTLLLPGSEPMRFHADLPARIEADGSLRIQVRAGTWQVQLTSRFTANTNQLAMTQASADWPAQEIWSFTAAANTRGVKITGVEALDPSQLDVPQNWKSLPTYLLEKGSTLILTEQYRGDVAPAANQIKAVRIVWLDFDGRGATVKDTLAGVMNQGWRLLAQTHIQLGRVAVDGEPQLVTRSTGDTGDGVEIRQRRLNLEAISRLADRRALTASGWQHDIEQLRMIVHLPPGWKLWHVSGADSIDESWLSRWDLWDLFLCLLIVGATFRLLGLPWAALATLTLALIYHESNAPVITWVVLIVALPLLKVLPPGRLRRAIGTLGYVALFSLLLVSLLFAVQQIRRGLYPQLEQQRAINAPSSGYGYGSARVAARIPVPADVMSRDGNAPAALEMQSKDLPTSTSADLAATVVAAPPSPAAARPRNTLAQQKRYQPSANTQTGPGQPTWQWNTVQLGWSGPVAANAPLKLYLSAPWLTRILMFVQVGFVGLLVFGLGRLLLRLARRDTPSDAQGSTAATPGATVAILFAALLAGLPGDGNAAAAFPPQHLLEDWEQRLTQLPACAPQCLAINKVQISVTGATLDIRMRVGSGAEIGMPLPYDPSWRVNRALVDGTPSPHLARAGNRLWLSLPKGEHDVRIEAQLNGDSIIIPFPLTPHNVTVAANDWEIFGLQDDRVPSKSLQLKKREKSVSQDALLADPIAAFVTVNRHLDLDLDWRIRTTVSRVAPRQGALAVNIPLLDGESVVSEGVKVEEDNGKHYVAATFAAQQESVSWISAIKPVDTITLTAPNDALFVETWSAQSSPRWHMSFTGLTPIKSDNNQQEVIPRWLPWPGERLQISVAKPAAVAGPTTTVEGVVVDSKPGARSTVLELSLSLRTSLGGDFRIEPPDNATLEQIELDGQQVTQQQELNTVILPLHPGLQSAKVRWLIAEGVALRSSTPKISLSVPAGNIDLKLTLPSSRWPLLVSGPDIGPAMLYWGVLIVILCVAVALGKVTKIYGLSVPLSSAQWVLLALGMSTVNMLGSIPLVLWFFAMEARARSRLPARRWVFNLIQVALVLLSIVALGSLFATIPESLLASPDMQVTGNGSYNYFYNWYQDNSDKHLPQGHIISVPIWVYRVAMLAWSLWLVFALLRWVKWSWDCLGTRQLWAAKPADSEAGPERGARD